MENKYAVILNHVTKEYIIHHEKPTLAERLLNGKAESFCALKNINLKIKKGERIGILGSNGSGKTTLLKIISGITYPTSGEVKTEGKLVSLIDLEAGFHPDLTGIQNIYLNGMIIGMNKNEISKKLNKIISFADVGSFINAPIFTYSEGMKLRLGFSVAINSDPDILAIDENLSVGDENFAKKSTASIFDMFKKGKTIIVASHNLDFIQKTCDNALLLKNGKIFLEGKPKNVISKYHSTTKFVNDKDLSRKKS